MKKRDKIISNDISNLVVDNKLIKRNDNWRSVKMYLK